MLRLLKAYVERDPFRFSVNTHMHADHITGSGKLKQISGCKSIISACSGADADIHVDENDFVEFGRYKLKVLSTPGHTNGCISYYFEEQVTRNEHILV